jgi:tetratricopeptide (TPR) repeat protein
MKKNEPDQAIEDYNRAIKRDPKNEEAYYLRGMASAAKQDTERALEDYNKAIELNPKYVQAYLNRSMINLAAKELEPVIADTTKVIEINSKIPAAYYVRGLAYASDSEMAQAIANYDEAIKLRPEYVEAYLNRALAYAYKEKIELTKADKHSPAAYVNIGLDQLSESDYRQAISDSNKAVKLAPKLANAYGNRAKIYMMGGDLDKAWLDVHKAKELGGEIDPGLLKELESVSGRKE